MSVGGLSFLRLPRMVGILLWPHLAVHTSHEYMPLGLYKCTAADVGVVMVFCQRNDAAEAGRRETSGKAQTSRNILFFFFF